MLETNPHEFFMKSSLIMYRSLRVKLKKKKKLPQEKLENAF